MTDAYTPGVGWSVTVMSAAARPDRPAQARDAITSQTILRMLFIAVSPSAHASPDLPAAASADFLSEVVHDELLERLGRLLEQDQDHADRQADELDQGGDHGALERDPLDQQVPAGLRRLAEDPLGPAGA